MKCLIVFAIVGVSLLYELFIHDNLEFNEIVVVNLNWRYFFVLNL